MSRGIFDKRIKASSKIGILVIAGFFIAVLVYYFNSGKLANDIAEHGFNAIVGIAMLVFLIYLILSRSGMGTGGKHKRR